jgi:hypothetical protein
VRQFKLTHYQAALSLDIGSKVAVLPAKFADQPEALKIVEATG